MPTTMSSSASSCGGALLLCFVDSCSTSVVTEYISQWLPFFLLWPLLWPHCFCPSSASCHFLSSVLLSFLRLFPSFSCFLCSLIQAPKEAGPAPGCAFGLDTAALPCGIYPSIPSGAAASEQFQSGQIIKLTIHFVSFAVGFNKSCSPDKKSTFMQDVGKNGSSLFLVLDLIEQRLLEITAYLHHHRRPGSC